MKYLPPKSYPVGAKCNIKDGRGTNYWWGDSSFTSEIVDVLPTGGMGDMCVVRTAHGYGRYIVPCDRIEVEPAKPKMENVQFTNRFESTSIRKLLAAQAGGDIVSYCGNGLWTITENLDK